ILLPRNHVIDPTVSVTKESLGCKTNPQIVLTIRKQTQHAAGGKRRCLVAIQQAKACAIEANQPLLGSDPEIAVFGLRDGMDRAPGKSLLRAPLIVRDFRERPP